MVKVKVRPQVKVTCKQITPKLIIESIDKRTLNNLKKSIDKYYLAVEIIDSYKGEIDKDGCAVDTNDYNAWAKNHPNKISKQSVNNIIKSIKNNSLVNWTIGEDISGIGYNRSETYFDGFNIALLAITLEPYPIMHMTASLAKINYGDNFLSFDISNGDFESK